MADKKISELTGATTPLAGTEVLPIVQSGATVKVAVSDLTTGRAVNTNGGTFTDNQTQGTAGKGVNFTANTPAAGMTSQLINWYEEGTWTPQYTHTTPPTTPYTMTITSATYTRVGQMVTVRAFIATSSVNTACASGALKISGLPFTSANHGVINIGYSINWAVNTPSTGYVESGATTIQLQYRALANSATASLAPSDLTSGVSAGQNQLIFVAVYFV